MHYGKWLNMYFGERQNKGCEGCIFSRGVCCNRPCQYYGKRLFHLVYEEKVKLFEWIVDNKKDVAFVSISDREKYFEQVLVIIKDWCYEANKDHPCNAKRYIDKIQELCNMATNK